MESIWDERQPTRPSEAYQCRTVWQVEWQDKGGQNYYKGMQMCEQHSLIVHTVWMIGMLFTHLCSLEPMLFGVWVWFFFFNLKLWKIVKAKLTFTATNHCWDGSFHIGEGCIQLCNKSTISNTITLQGVKKKNYAHAYAFSSYNQQVKDEASCTPSSYQLTHPPKKPSFLHNPPLH